ncbi:MAG: E3 ubiquitin-protein ligase rad18 [Alectoria sarmentosa]|nr:MAG: E3 ubiquitin-protein ligase rad18 [Alectoria sarmentosa]
MKLRANSTVQELVDAFKVARPAVLKFGRNAEAAKDGRGKIRKRKIDDTELEEDGDGDEEYVDHNLRRRKARQSPAQLNVIANSRRPSKASERLPQLNYSLLKDTALRKKLSELGIPNGGPKDLLIRRHTEWVNLVNANCDSSKPKTKRELVHELEAWDRTQGRQILSNCNEAGSASSVMSKSFDGAVWASNHGSNFQVLIAQARRKVNPKVESISSTNSAPDSLLDQGIDKGYVATSLNRISAKSVDLLHDLQSSGNPAGLGVDD